MESALQTEQEVTEREKLHKSIKRTAKVLRKDKPDKHGAVRAIGDDLCGVVVGKSSIERAITLLNALALRLDKSGLLLTPANKAMSITLKQDVLLFTLKEITKREKHIPTEGEKTAEALRIKAARQRWGVEHCNKYMMGKYYCVYPEFDTVQTGKLVLQVGSQYDRVNRKWSDRKTQKLEDMVEDIALGLESLLGMKRFERERKEEYDRQYQEYSRRQILAKRREERDEDRWKYLKVIVGYNKEIEEVESWLKQNAADNFQPGGDYNKLIDWAKSHLEHLRYVISAENIEQDLKPRDFFPENDPLHDPLGDPVRPLFY